MDIVHVPILAPGRFVLSGLSSPHGKEPVIKLG